MASPLYVRLAPGPVARTLDVADRGQVFVDLAEDGSLVGVEILCPYQIERRGTALCLARDLCRVTGAQVELVAVYSDRGLATYRLEGWPELLTCEVMAALAHLKHWDAGTAAGIWAGTAVRAAALREAFYLSCRRVSPETMAGLYPEGH